MSILPKKAETLPSALTAMKDESWSGVSGGLVAVACAKASPMPSTVSSPIGAPIETTSAPAPLNSERREMLFSILVMFASLAHHLGRALDRAQDADMRPATALEAGERVLDLVLGRLLLLVEQGGCCHHPAVDAIAALRHLFLDVGLLDRVRLFGRAQPSERHHLAVADGRDRRHAGADRLAVEMHRAGPALRKPAAEMWIVQTDVVAQRIEQRH